MLRWFNHDTGPAKRATTVATRSGYLLATTRGHTTRYATSTTNEVRRQSISPRSLLTARFRSPYPAPSVIGLLSHNQIACALSFRQCSHHRAPYTSIDTVCPSPVARLHFSGLVLNSQRADSGVHTSEASASAVGVNLLRITPELNPLRTRLVVEASGDNADRRSTNI